jgi:CRP-like cAMP-binding protein
MRSLRKKAAKATGVRNAFGKKSKDAGEDKQNGIGAGRSLERQLSTQLQGKKLRKSKQKLGAGKARVQNRKGSDVIRASSFRTQSKDSRNSIVKKSMEAKLAIIGALRMQFLFAELSDKEISSVVDAMEKLEVAKGHEFLRGDSQFYVVEAGKFRVSGEGDEPPSLVTDGGSFNNLALLNDEVAGGSSIATDTSSILAVAMVTSILWVLDRPSYRNALASIEGRAFDDKIEFLRRVPCLSNAMEEKQAASTWTRGKNEQVGAVRERYRHAPDPRQLNLSPPPQLLAHDVAEAFQTVRFPAKTQIFQEGDEARVFFIVCKGGTPPPVVPSLPCCPSPLPCSLPFLTAVSLPSHCRLTTPWCSLGAPLVLPSYPRHSGTRHLPGARHGTLIPTRARPGRQCMGLGRNPTWAPRRWAEAGDNATRRW